MFRAGVFYPDAQDPAYPVFEWGRECLLLSGSGNAPEAAGVVLVFLGSAFPIGNDGTMVLRGAVVISIGPPQMIPIGSEGVPVVSSEVVGSESVGTSRPFRMLEK